VNCGDNIKVYFNIGTHEIPLRVRQRSQRAIIDLLSSCAQCKRTAHR
jgi:hypothetical protein